MAKNPPRSHRLRFHRRDQPEEFYSDFHGETPAEGTAQANGTAQAKVVEYRQATRLSANDALIAPDTGVHG